MSIDVQLPDSETLRGNVRTWLRVAAMVAKFTPRTDLDDKLIAAAQQIVENDDAWTVAYSICELLFERQTLMTADAEETAKMLAERTGLDIAVIVQLISLVLKLIDEWRKRQSNGDEEQDETPIV